MRRLISLGCRCDVAFQLRMHGAENVAHFFDWLATSADGVIKIIEADFDVFHPDHLVHNTNHKPHCVEDSVTGVMFHHQFPMFAGNVPPDFLLFYQPFISKFQHLANRFREYLRSRPITLVRQDITEEQALRLEQAMTTRFPDADLRFLYVLNSGTVFQTPLGHARLLKNDWSSLGDPAEWATMLVEEGLTEAPYRHATAEILGASHDDHNLLPDNRFSESQLLAAITANPRSAAFPLELSRWYTAKGMSLKAEEMAIGALARDPHDLEAQFQAAGTQWRNNRIDAQAAAELLRAVASTPKPRALWLRETSNALQSSGQYEEALVYATAAIATDPLDRFNYLQKAHCLMEMGRFSDAVLAMEAAIRLGSISHVQQHRYAVILQELGRVQEAVDVEQSVVEAVPEFFPSLFKRAELLVSLDRPQEGLEAYRAALPLAGGHAATVENRITALTQLSAPATQAPTPVKPVSAAENIKMIIWDLDETFWSGTLSEEGIKPIQAHIDLIKEMSGRGIVNSICSKNDFAAAERELRKLEIWDHFVFPKIEFSPKGAMIRDIIDAAQLRAPSVLFVDDNVMNLNEAVHYSPGLQIAEPDVISRLLDDARCAGKTDPKMERLARYKVLEQKFLAQANAGADNIDFLRESGIRVSFHHDVMSEFPRIHDLVNRSNQLNFTKKRWPEDENLAREAFTEELAAVFDSHSGYIKVADRYGNYGICGFYMTRGAACQHFLFSCRAMNMGVEQFVWHKLNRPHVNISSEVASTLEASPDWITVVEDADKVDPQIADTSAKPLICVRGACDLMMMTHYLRTRFDTIEEFTFPYKGWAIHQLARVVALEKDLQIPASQALLAMLPGIPPNRFESAVNTGAADVYVLSFSAEIFGGLRRSRTTGIILPLYEEKIGDQDFRNVSYAELQERYNGAAQVNAQEWAFLQDEFENIPHLHEPQLKADLTDVFTKLRGKTVIVLMLNTKVGNRKWTLDAFAKINAIVRPIAESFNAHIIELEEMVRSVDDLADPEDPGVHFSRRIYMQLADRIAEICEAHATRTPAGGLNVDRVKSN